MDRRAFLQKGIMAGVAASANPGLAPAASDATASAVRAGSDTQSDKPPIVIENAEFRFAIGSNGIARSLIHKSSGQECLDTSAAVPVFWMKQYQPLPGQFKLAHRTEAKVFPARSVRREDIPSQIAAQLLQALNICRQRHLSQDVRREVMNPYPTVTCGVTSTKMDVPSPASYARSLLRRIPQYCEGEFAKHGKVSKRTSVG